MLERLVSRGGVIALLGGIDAGKTTFGLSLAEAARARGLPTAYIDADVGQSSVGPPTCVGLKFVNELERVDLESVARADQLAFVGSITPSGHLLPMVVGTARLVAQARRAGAELIVVDTTGLISGPYAEILKYHKLQLVRPDVVVGFQRGQELDPILGVVTRFFPAEVIGLKVHAAVSERTVEERMAYREASFRAYFQPPLQRWRVKTTVFMPTLPVEMDFSRLDGLVVGLEDGKGACLGIGLLDYDGKEEVLRMVTPVSEGAKGLLLGGVRMSTEGRMVGAVTTRELFGSE